MANGHSVKLEFGALSDPLYKQLGLPRRRLRYLQDCADAVVNLRVGGFISPAIADRTRGRIYIRIIQTFGKELRGHS